MPAQSEIQHRHRQSHKQAKALTTRHTEPDIHTRPPRVPGDRRPGWAGAVGVPLPPRGVERVDLGVPASERVRGERSDMRMASARAAAAMADAGLTDGPQR